MTKDNTLFHYNDGTTDKYYQNNNNVYSLVDYKIKANNYYIWKDAVTTLTLVLEPIEDEEKIYYNEYMIEFTTSATGTPTIIFPSNIKWNAAPSIEKGHTYQVSILNGIGCIIADNKSVS